MFYQSTSSMFGLIQDLSAGKLCFNHWFTQGCPLDPQYFFFEALSRYWQHLSDPQKFGISQQRLKSCSPLLSEALLLGCIVGPGRDWWSHEASQPFQSAVMSGIDYRPTKINRLIEKAPTNGGNGRVNKYPDPLFSWSFSFFRFIWDDDIQLDSQGIERWRSAQTLYMGWAMFCMYGIVWDLNKNHGVATVETIHGVDWKHQKCICLP